MYIANWIDTDRVSGDYHRQGIPIDQLWSSFANEHPSHAEKEWTLPRFKKALFDYVSYVPELDYNPHLASNGSTEEDSHPIYYITPVTEYMLAQAYHPYADDAGECDDDDI